MPPSPVPDQLERAWWLCPECRQAFDADQRGRWHWADDEGQVRCHGLPVRVCVGQVWEHNGTGLRMRIIQVPDGRKRTFRFVYVNPRVSGNGWRDRSPHKLHNPAVLARRYRLVCTSLTPDEQSAKTEGS